MMITRLSIKKACPKRHHINCRTCRPVRFKILIVTAIMFCTIYFIILIPTQSKYEDMMYANKITHRKLVFQNGHQNGEYFDPHVHYAANKGYMKVKERVLITRQISSELMPSKGHNYSKPQLRRYNNTFLNKLNVFAIPLNRTAFGPTYTLNETRAEIYDFPFIINCSNVCKTTSDPFLVIMILSVHTHIDTRVAIRNTWGRAANPGVWPKVGVLNQKVKLIFLFGTAANELGNNIVREESKMYGDVVQADFVDSYFNLTYKTVTGVRWVAEFCPGAKYILKADEDVFVHVHNLITFLSNRENNNHEVIFGHVLINSDVYREGRWSVSKRAFPLSVYPEYTCGNTYVISGKMAAHIYYTAGLLPYLNIEDVFVTGIVRTFLNAELVDVIGFTHWFEKKPKPCEFKNPTRISATKVVDYVQYELWEGLKTKEADCYKIIQNKHMKVNRPERSNRMHIMRDEHIFMHKTNGTFYVL